MSRNALGRGLSALIREPEVSQQPQQQAPVHPPVEGPVQHPVAQPGAPPEGIRQGVAAGSGAATAAVMAPARVPSEGLLQVDIDLIDPSPYQPRTYFREQALEELAQSIRTSGIIQPLVVRRVGERYQLIAGERRWRAAQRAPIGRVPVVLRDVSEEAALEMALVENLQREDLNPIEQARAFERLIDEFAFTQEEVAERTGKDRATIANALRLLKLEETIQDMLEEGRISAGHARALLAITDPKDRFDLAKRVARGGMTVRQVERIAARTTRPRTSSTVTVVDPNTRAAIEEMQRKFGTKVFIQPLRPGRPGQVIFEYYDAADLNRIYDQLMRQ